MSEKEIAKEILIHMIEKDYLMRTEYPDAKTVAEMVGMAYKEIVKVVQED